jgi:hypothetical protein
MGDRIRPRMDLWKYGKEKNKMNKKYLENSKKELSINDKHEWNLNLIEEPTMETSRSHISHYKQ